MRNRSFYLFVFALLISSCGTPPAPIIPTETITATIAATETQVPTQTPVPTDTQTPTPIPGKVVLPIDTLGRTKPWLPYDETAIPAVSFFAFNVEKPPFNSALVRQAFAAAIDREVIGALYTKYGINDLHLATTLTPPEVLGRDLYGEVGISFDPIRAKDLLREAGYEDPSSFPEVTFMVNVGGDAAPGAHQNAAQAAAKMWQENLGVTVKVETLNWNAYRERLASNPPEIYRMGWAADYNDPHNFLGDVFQQINYGKFFNSEFYELVSKAGKTSGNAAIRQELYIQAEKVLCEIEVGVIPLYHYTYKP